MPDVTPDITGDGKVDAFDLNRIAVADPAADVNHDGVIDAIDLNILAAHWQEHAFAGWDRPSGETYSGPFSPGVMGSHPNGTKYIRFLISWHVEMRVVPLGGGQNRIEVVRPFASDGVPWVAKFPMVVSDVNPDTGKQSFYITLDAKNCHDGPGILEAVLVPNSGEEMPLVPFTFFTNYWGS